MLILGATSAIALTEVEKPTSGIKRLKTPYLSTVSDKRESDLSESISAECLRNVYYSKILTAVENKRTNVCKTLSI